MNIQVDPDWGGPPATASDHGGGNPGFTGTARHAADAAGLITVAAEPFGGGPTVPMLPETWAGGSAIADPAAKG